MSNEQCTAYFEMVIVQKISCLFYYHHSIPSRNTQKKPSLSKIKSKPRTAANPHPMSSITSQVVPYHHPRKCSSQSDRWRAKCKFSIHAREQSGKFLNNYSEICSREMPEYFEHRMSFLRPLRYWMIFMIFCFYDNNLVFIFS